MKPQIPWLRVFVEGVVIVGSILLALWADAWLEGHSERDREAVLIERLHDEFLENQRILEQFVHANRRFNAAALELATMEPETLGDLSDDSLRTLLNPIGGWHIFNPVGAEFLSMVQSGEFRLIQSGDLRAALSAWSEAVDIAGVQAQ